MIVGRNLLVVAHPDDEVLFAYSQLVNGNWHVVSLTGASRQTKSEFKSVMRSLGLTYEIWDYNDDWNGTFPTEEVIPKLEEVLSKGFDNVLTHSSSGEYGHTQHRILYIIMSHLVHKNFYVFGEKRKLLSFSLLRDKIKTLSKYKTQCSLNAFDWYDQNDPENNLMKFVVSEGYRKVK